MKELAEQYATDELPDDAKTSIDLPHEEIIALTLNPAYLLYTQVDAEGEIVYSKGLQTVNRTGVYAWVPKSE